MSVCLVRSCAAGCAAKFRGLVPREPGVPVCACDCACAGAGAGAGAWCVVRGAWCVVRGGCGCECVCVCGVLCEKECACVRKSVCAT